MAMQNNAPSSDEAYGLDQRDSGNKYGVARSLAGFSDGISGDLSSF